jgi:hypothetical protein
MAAQESTPVTNLGVGKLVALEYALVDVWPVLSLLACQMSCGVGGADMLSEV